MGEVRGLLPIIKLFKERHPTVRTLLTSTSPTGLDAGKADVDEVHILPIDSAAFHNRAIGTRNIIGLIINETEVWPSLLMVAHTRKIPTFLVNARISDLAIKRYEKLRFILKEALPQFTRVLTSTKESFDRYLSLGCTESQLRVMGNSKYDGVRVVSEGERDEFRSRFGFDNAPILCLGSIRDGEDGAWLGAIRTLYDEGLKFHVIVAPRHREKFEYFASVLTAHNLPFTRYTTWEERSSGSCEGNKVLLLDTYGKLLEAYSVSSIAFIGATLVNIGGHNPFEAAAQEVPVIVGHHVQNIKNEVADLAKVGALFTVRDQDEIVVVLRNWLNAPKEFIQRGRDGATQWLQHQGSSLRIMAEIESNMEIPYAVPV
jgi:3-deoxy-D-manno-octulosonic-acid transferase